MSEEARRRKKAQRQQRWRENKRNGQASHRVVLAREDITLLVTAGYLARSERGNPAAVNDALQLMVDRTLVGIAEGRFAP